MQNLPINHVLPGIKDALARNNRVVLQAPPGAGKTTAVPVALLDQAWLKNKQIIVLEPRRLAARNAAARMAFLLNEKPGQTVGYQIRQDSCYSEATKILVVTEGILTRRLQADPEQKNTALIIFDEFHERSLDADLSLALCLQSQQILREDLKILVMSATLNTHAISDLLGNAPVIQSEGRSYPVEINYLDKPLKQSASGYENNLLLITQLSKTIKQFINERQGNCLVFLPGVKQINQLASKLRQQLPAETGDNIIIAPLHGSLSKQQQDQAIAAPADGIRKIVLATNIAETSLTIEGISCVVDSGLERVSHYNPSSAMNGLKTQFISLDSAEQRSGRAGRLSAGICYRLWTAQQQQRLIKHSVAEILHSDLSPLALELANWGVQQVNELQWMDQPPASAMDQGRALLQQLKAIDLQGRITAHGRDMLTLGTHPRLAHMMLSAVELGQVYHACLIASILSEKDIFLASADKSADIHERLNVLQQSATPSTKQRPDIDYNQCKRIIQNASDYLKRIQRCTDKKRTIVSQSKGTIDSQYSGVLLAYAYPDRIAKQRSENEARYLLSSGKGAVIPPHLQHHLHQYLVIANLDAMQVNARQGEASIYLAAEISGQQLEEYFPDCIEVKENIEWNEMLQRVESKKTATIGKIILKQTIVKADDREAVQSCLLGVIKNSGLDILNWTPQAVNLRQRVEFINHYVRVNKAINKQYADMALPDFSDASLINSLEGWLKPGLSAETSIKQCQKLDLYTLLRNQLSWEQQQWINQQAPEKIQVPSGSEIRIDYSDPTQAVLAVRLQEVFGLYKTPTVLNGDSVLMMHLLSP
ncbi:MAG: ATP-dependent helicase HrpB, partial [Gammaproteobacteria bacterium]|nr:ATP-dependent helicase HrpB [Gammaproteobacteria bacterium]